MTFVDEITVEALDDDPYPIYRRLREEAPVANLPAFDVWFVTRWADVAEAAEDAGRFPASMPGSPLDRTLGGPSVLTLDGDEQHALREPMERTLRPRSLGDAPDLVHRIATELLDKIADRGEAELMDAFCEPFAVLSLAEHIGLGGIDAPTLRRWFAELATGTSNYEDDPRKQAIANATSAEIDAVLRPRFEALLADPEHTMVSHLLHATDGSLDDRMSWFMPTLKLALIGGLQEPAHGIGSTVFGLLSDPSQAASYRADPSVQVRRAVEEGLRWTSPIGTAARTVAADTVLGGVDLPAGAPLTLMVSSANRDEAVWGPTADRFDLFRPRHAHGAFGFGSHFCVGHSLARVQVRTAMLQLFDRLPGLRLDPDRPPVFRGWEYRGPASLHVRWDPA